MRNDGINRDDVIEREHAALTKLSRELDAALQVQVEEIAAREERGAPLKRILRNHERLRDRYWSVEARRRQLQSLLPERPPAAEEF